MTNQPLAQDVAVKSAEAIFQKTSAEEKANPSAFLDAHREQCEIIIKAQGIVGLAKAIGMPKTTVYAWAKKRGVVTPRKQSKVAHSSPKKPPVTSTGPNKPKATHSSFDPLRSYVHWKARAEALELALRLVLERQHLA